MAVLGRFFEAFDLRRALRFGLVPLVWQQAAYASLYLQQEVRAWIAYRGGKDSLSYWRTRASREVDFVVYGPDTFLALEVKLSRNVDRRALAIRG